MNWEKSQYLLYIKVEEVIYMGRSIGCGIVSDITIINKNNIDKERILKQLNRHIDVSKYKIIEKDNVIHLSIKTIYVNNNINELLKELGKYVGINSSYELYDSDKKIYNYKLEEMSNSIMNITIGYCMKMICCLII